MLCYVFCPELRNSIIVETCIGELQSNRIYNEATMCSEEVTQTTRETATLCFGALCRIRVVDVDKLVQDAYLRWTGILGAVCVNAGKGMTWTTAGQDAVYEPSRRKHTRTARGRWVITGTVEASARRAIAEMPREKTSGLIDALMTSLIYRHVAGRFGGRTGGHWTTECLVDRPAAEDRPTTHAPSAHRHCLSSSFITCSTVAVT